MAENNTDERESPISFTDSETRANEMQHTVETWLADLQQSVEDATASDQYKNWLDFQSRFHDYSVRNSLLIKLQCPEASRVAGYRMWQTEFDRHVRAGESAIWIWAPITAKKCPACERSQSRCEQSDCDSDETPPAEWSKGVVGFRPVPVFDVSQTTGEPLPSLDTKVYGDAHRLVPALLDAAEPLELQSELVTPTEWSHGSADGICEYRGNGQPPRITVKNQPNQAMVAHTLVHEYAHALLHVERNDEQSAREVEAESVAYIVSRALGLDAENASFYIAAWRNDEMSVLQARLSRITRTVTKLLGNVEASEQTSP